MRTKDDWRRWARDLPAVPDDVVDAVNDHLATMLASTPGPVLGYDALADEIGLAVPVDALPRLDDDGTMTARAVDGDREVHALGFEQPAAASPQLRPADLGVVLVPGRVFDRSGYRLGRGGGHYDRLLPHVASTTPVVGVTCEDRLVDELPREAHDVPMTHLATERGVFPTR